MAAYFAGEIYWVVQNGLLVGRSSDEVLHHVLLLAEVAVELEVLTGAALLRPLTATASQSYSSSGLSPPISHLNTLLLLLFFISTMVSPNLLES